MGALYRDLKMAEVEADFQKHVEDYTATEAVRVVNAVKELAVKIPHTHLERVPVFRLVKAVGWQDKLQMSAIKFLPGWLIGAGTYAISVFREAGLSGMIDGTVEIIAAGGVGGAALAAYKFVKETMKDKKIEKDVREPLRRVEDFEGAKRLETLSSVFSAIVMLSKLGGLDIPEAMKQVSIHLNLMGKLPLEIGELFTSLGPCLADGKLTTDEIQVIIEDAVDVKDAYQTIVRAWSAR